MRKKSKKEKLMTKKQKFKAREAGMVTIPFLLVSMILIFLILSFLFLNMTLAHVSITQYMSYSTARKLFLADETEADQQKAAQDHYSQLRTQFFNPSAHTGNTGDWFEIPLELEDKNTGTQYSNYPERGNNDRKRFYGVIVQFTTHILRLKVPFLSEGNEKALGGGIGSFLGREPSMGECYAFMEKKYESLAKRCNKSDCPNIQKPRGVDAYKGDNGC